jgi:hypothetical protein
MSQDQANAITTAPLAGQGQPEPPEPQPTAQAASFTLVDGMFCLFMVVVFCLVFWLGVFTRAEALKTEATKRNGEALAAWLKTASDARFKPGYVYAACAGLSEDEAPAETAAPASVAKPTWGACLDELLTKTELKNMRNPFLGQTPKFVTECKASDRSVAGGIDLDKIIATPAGSAVATVKSDLVKTDAIAEKIKIAITVCDKSGDSIKIEEIDF